MRTYEITVKRDETYLAYERCQLESYGDTHIRLMDMFTQTGLGLFNQDPAITVSVERLDV